MSTSLGYEFGYGEMFVRLLLVLATSSDLLVGISTSGNSSDLIKAFDYAKQTDLKTVGVTAINGGKLKQIAGDGIYVATNPNKYWTAKDAHMVLDQLIDGYLITIFRKGG